MLGGVNELRCSVRPAANHRKQALGCGQSRGRHPRHVLRQHGDVCNHARRHTPLFRQTQGHAMALRRPLSRPCVCRHRGSEPQQVGIGDPANVPSTQLSISERRTVRPGAIGAQRQARWIMTRASLTRPATRALHLWHVQARQAEPEAAV